MQEIAAIFGCSVRNCHCAEKDASGKWLDWQPQRAAAALTAPPVDLTGKAVRGDVNNQAAGEAGYGNVLRFIGNDKYLLDRAPEPVALWVQIKAAKRGYAIPTIAIWIRLTRSFPCDGPNAISCASA